MKILLVQPPSDYKLRTHVPGMVESRSGALPPLSLMYLAAMMKGTPHEVAILDCDADILNAEQVRAAIKGHNPDIVGITSTTFTIVDAVVIANLTKELFPQAKVIMGGPHGSIYPKETAAMPSIDYVLQGEGELVFPMLIEAIYKKTDELNVPGVSCKRNGEVQSSCPAGTIQDLDSIPFPDRTIIKSEKYFSLLSHHKYITTMITSRGCPYQCSFCFRHTGKEFRAVSAERVVDEMELCKKMGFEEIFMVDDTFTVDKKRVLDICASIKRRGLKIGWDVRANVLTLMDHDIIVAMKEAGCLRIHIGVESGTAQISKVIRKHLNLDKARKTFDFIRETGMQLLTYFMIGHPTETREQVLETIEYAIDINPDFAQFSITTPFPATELYSQGLTSGFIKEDYWKRFAENPLQDFTPPYWTETLPEEELLELSALAHRRFYMRPSYILRTLKGLRSLTEFRRKAATGWSIFCAT